jgi:hypothetical protein
LLNSRAAVRRDQSGAMQSRQDLGPAS